MRGPRIRRFGTFSGGIDLPDDKGPTLDAPIRQWEKIESLSLPLTDGPGPPAAPLVHKDQKVRQGQMLAAGHDDGPDIFAPADAVVRGFTTVEIAARDVMRKSPAVNLEIGSEIKLPGSEPRGANWRKLDELALWDHLTAGQLTIHRPGGLPLNTWILRARSKCCGLLVANGMEQQPLVTANHRLLVEFGAEVVEGLAILARAGSAGPAALVVPRRRTDAYRRLVPAAREHNITRVALSHKYPTEADPILVKVLTRRRIAPGCTPMDARVAVVDPATCFAVYRWVVCGQRLAGRVVTVSGSKQCEPGNYFVPFGTVCRDLVGPDEPVVIHGGPMVGMRCGSTTVVTAGTDAVLSVTPSPHEAPNPCIRCGWCTDHCPARLNVAALNDDFELGQLAAARRSGASACVGCGICSYICPARLPLAQRVKELKQAVIEYAAATTKNRKE